jgi:hypothetical protein
MENTVVCRTCSTENAYQDLNCSKCGGYLRARVVNIDLWQTIWDLIESPSKAFANIIHSEHKNFIILIISFAGFKIFLNSTILGNVFPKLIHAGGLLRFLLYPAVILILLILFSLLYSSITNSLGIKAKFKNALAMFIYALMPHIFALILFTCIELALFGIYLFYFNPDPFFIKPVPAYILAGLEFLFIIWSSILAFIASYTYTRGKLYSVITALVYTLLMWGAHFII